MTTKGKRLAHAHAVRVLRGLGRELVAGSWSRDAEPMTEPEAFTVIAAAVATVARLGVASVAAAFDEVAARVLGR